MDLRDRTTRALAGGAKLRFFRLFSRALGAAAPPASLAMRPLESREFAGLCADPGLELAEDRVRLALDRGDRCVGAFDGTQLVGYCWLAFRPLPHLDGVWVDFPPHAVWTYKSLVLPSHRGRGIAPALYRRADALAIERGRSVSLLCVEAHNRPSIRAALRAGYASCGRAGYLRRSRGLSTWRSPASRWASLRFYIPT